MKTSINKLKKQFQKIRNIKCFSAFGNSYCHNKTRNLEIVSRSGNKWLRFDKASNDYPFFKKIHYSSTARFWRYEQYSPVEGSFYQLKQCHIQQSMNQELQTCPFSSLSPLTTKHWDRYMLKVAPIIDMFICLVACCHVTITKANGNFHSSTFATSKL